MPNYEYRCDACGLKFERRQTMSEAAITQCPSCGASIHRLVTGGAGFILKGASSGPSMKSAKECSLQTTGRTCCGRDQRCGKPDCGSEK